MDRTLIDATADNLAAAIGALLDAPGTAVRSSDVIETRWVVRLTFAGRLTGTMSVGMNAASAIELTRGVMALDQEPPEASIADTLLEICSQAGATIGQQGEFRGLQVMSCTIDTNVPAGEPVVFAVSAGDRFSGALALWNNSAAVASPIEPAAPAAIPEAPSNLEIILDIDLPLSVRFGETEMTLQALTRLAPGSVIDLGRSPEDPVDILVNGKLVARGEVVVVTGNYGVRIKEVISASDRLRTLAA